MLTEYLAIRFRPEEFLEGLLWREPVQGEQGRLVHRLRNRGHLLLGVAIHRFALREELAYLLVHVLDRGLLVALERVTEEQICPLRPLIARELDTAYIRETRIPVRQDRREDLAEFLVADPGLEQVEDLDDLAGISLFYYEEQNEMYFRQNQG